MAALSSPEWPAFVVTLDYTDAELKSVERVLNARRDKGGKASWSRWDVLLTVGSAFLFGNPARRNWFWWTLLLSIAIGFLVVWAAIALGLGDRDASGPLGIAIVVTFWLGVYLPALFMRRSRRRRAFHTYREEWAGVSLLLSPRGLVLRRPHIRAAYGREAIGSVGRFDGLLLIWVAPRRPFAIPERLLTAEQLAWVLTIRPLGKPALSGGDAGG